MASLESSGVIASYRNRNFGGIFYFFGSWKVSEPSLIVQVVQVSWGAVIESDDWEARSADMAARLQPNFSRGRTFEVDCSEVED